MKITFFKENHLLSENTYMVPGRTLFIALRWRGQGRDNRQREIIHGANFLYINQLSCNRK